MQTMKLNRVDRSLLDEARKAFRGPRVQAGVCRDTLMLEQGAINAIEWLEAKLDAKGSDAVGAPADHLEFDQSYEGVLKRWAKA